MRGVSVLIGYSKDERFRICVFRDLVVRREEALRRRAVPARSIVAWFGEGKEGG